MAEKQPITAEQLKLVLEQIAGGAATLADFARNAAVVDGWPDPETSFHIITAMAERLGILADAACGEQIIGNPMEWACGSNYHRPAGEETAHG